MTRRTQSTIPPRRIAREQVFRLFEPLSDVERVLSYVARTTLANPRVHVLFRNMFGYVPSTPSPTLFLFSSNRSLLVPVI